MAEKTIKSPKAPKRFENILAEFTTYMVEQIAQRFENQAIGGLHVSTVEKFSDAQVGNYANVFLKLSKQVKRKLLKQFDNKRIEGFVGSLLSKVDKYGQQQVYLPAEEVLGINMKQLLARDISQPQVNALIQESIQWVKKLRDETLESFTSETLRQMSQGKDLNDIVANTKEITSKRKNAAKFVARNQVANFNAMTTKIRHQKLGIEKGIWVTSKDERVRKSHKERNGKEFDLSEGLYSSEDGKTLFPGTDYQCRCTYRAIIPEFEEML
jgi:SPP1 gp7 family putative phage head morphogenesis protein